MPTEPTSNNPNKQSGTGSEPLAGGTRLSEIVTQLHNVLEQASTASTRALECGNQAGALLDEAKAIHERDRSDYRAWLRDEFGRNKEWASQLIGIHERWPEIEAKLNDQTVFSFWTTAARRTLQDHTSHSSDNAAFDPRVDVPEEAFDIPDTISVDFQYPEEDEHDSPPAADVLSKFFCYVVPRQLKTEKDWRTLTVRVMGVAYLIGAVPDDVSMRDACNALGVSHATISKYVRQLADKTGIRSPIMKREGARETYSRVQKEKHWRRRGDG